MERTVKAHATKFVTYLKEFKKMSFSSKMLVFLYLFSLAPVLYLILMGVNARIGLSSINEVLPSIVMGVLAVLSIGALWKRLKWWDLLFVVAVGAFYIYSPNIYPQTTYDILMRAPEFLLTVLPYYLIGASMDLKKDSNTLLHVGRIAVLATLLLVVVGRLFGLSMSFYDDRSENMGQAYLFLTPLLFIVWNELRHHNTTDFLLSGIGLIMLLGFGTRGPVFSLVLFVALMLVIKARSLSKILLLIIAALVVILLMDPLLSVFSDILSVFGMSDRAVSSMMDVENMDTSGRDDLWEYLINMINHNGSYGSGLYSDRSVIVINGENTYAHNIFLELAFDFGIMITVAVLAVMLIMFVLDVIKLKNTEMLSLWLVFFCFGFVPLLISDSYLERSEFWLLLGLSMTVLRTPRNYYTDNDTFTQLTYRK